MVTVLVSSGPVCVSYGGIHRVVFDGVSRGTSSEQIASEMVEMDDDELNALVKSHLTVVISVGDPLELRFGHRLLLRRRYFALSRADLELEMDKLLRVMALTQSTMGMNVESIEGVIKSTIGDINRRETQIDQLETTIDSKLEPQLVLEPQDASNVMNIP